MSRSEMSRSDEQIEQKEKNIAQQSAGEVARVDSERRELRSSNQTTSELSRMSRLSRWSD